jgi:hypothetical protein
MPKYVVIKMPGGDLEYVATGEMLWTREAFDHENGKSMLRTNTDRIYPLDTVEELRRKFADEGTRLADFTPPDRDLVMVVNADNVREVEESSEALHHERAGAVLKFGTKLRLAVKETVKEAQVKLKAAKGKGSVTARVASARPGARPQARRG